MLPMASATVGSWLTGSSPDWTQCWRSVRTKNWGSIGPGGLYPGLSSLGSHWGVSPEFLDLGWTWVPLGSYPLVKRIDALWARQS